MSIKHFKEYNIYMLIFNLMYGRFFFSSWFVSNLIRFKLLILKIKEKILKFRSYFPS